ncbi:MAG: methylated-DNA--[protein]-cysteine S-methyltransferase [Alphaproteobacteria bacterium]|nr:methylated-DNA--[protein]-cysteine S-methyltransferase [Alphaproteobacteria bacterium SS10]
MGIAAPYAGFMDTPVGPITVFANDLAVTELGWGTERTADRPNAIVEQALAALTRYFDGDGGALGDLPTAPDVTEFRARILSAMRRIPPGTTKTYGELGKAARVSPGAVRAVGSACATNPIPIIIPCHRVVAAGGKMGGFSGLGGLNAKQWLLRHEEWNGNGDQDQRSLL